MDLGMTDRVRPMVEKLRRFVQDEVIPVEDEYHAEIGRSGDRWQPTERMLAIIAGLRQRARSEGLWNLFLTDSKHGAGLTTVEYAYLAEEMGWSPLASSATNCAAPDTGNMEVLARYGSKAQQDMQNAIDRITSFPEEAERPIVSLLSRRREVISLMVYVP